MNRLLEGRAAGARGPGALALASLTLGAVLASPTVSATGGGESFSAKAVATMRSCGEEPVINLADGSETYVSSRFTVDNDKERFLNGSEHGHDHH